MDLHRVLLSTLAVVLVPSLTGCPTTWNCNPPEEAFDVDDPLTVEQLEALATDWGVEDWMELDCESVCSARYSDERGWTVGTTDSCELVQPTVDGDGAMVEEGHIRCSGTGYEYLCEGRRPLGYVEAELDGGADELGRALVAMAVLEAASVLAFEELAGQLEGVDAPAQLVARCRAAAEDERRHARLLTLLVEARGLAVPAPHTQAEIRQRSLVEIAEHNAVEGCVSETFAALTARVFAERSTSPTLRRVFTTIAADETRHGQLAWDLRAFFDTKLGADERARVDAAQARALDQLPSFARQYAGLPAAFGGTSAETFEALGRTLGGRLRTQRAA
ncbi:putative lipoprotein [Plesiocystis pacifica SIR-1]|uniref:Putative lipoprotein n=1 Tax=Plesiocystis pacifica SIR-1 TaxID=391625 RepID=A6G5P0_9BACT|nr:ferritin-like domain-containing protein [Plesiocystis pacifica]EDM78821.1 putative lipoprotein [Plesiocystis pacifica SIR-1]